MGVFYGLAGVGPLVQYEAVATECDLVSAGHLLSHHEYLAHGRRLGGAHWAGPTYAKLARCCKGMMSRWTGACGLMSLIT